MGIDDSSNVQIWILLVLNRLEHLPLMERAPFTRWCFDKETQSRPFSYRADFNSLVPWKTESSIKSICLGLIFIPWLSLKIIRQQRSLLIAFSGSGQTSCPFPIEATRSKASPITRRYPILESNEFLLGFSFRR